MTSRQPGPMPPGTTGLVGTPDGTGTPGSAPGSTPGSRPGGAPGSTPGSRPGSAPGSAPGEGEGQAGSEQTGSDRQPGRGDRAEPALTAQEWLLRLLPLTLLII